MKTSFIIPSYNAASTINRCLDSIYSLPMDESEYEVLVIDDCSTDNTVELIKDYASHHSNLVLLCQSENHRQGAARNRGITVAKGKFIVFVDSDDETAKGVISAVRLAEKRELDMVAMRVALVSGDSDVVEEKLLPYENNQVFHGYEFQSDYPFWNTGPCAYVYRNTLLSDTKYPFAEDVLYEDSDFVIVHLYHANRMSYCDECGNKVHFNPESTTHTISYKHLSDYALLGTRMLKFYESIEDRSTKYAESVLEGGSYNIMKAFRKLFRLRSISEIRSFYDRFDARCERKLLLGYHKPAYCWTIWTRFCLKHRRLTTLIVGMVMPLLSIRTKK